MQCIQRNETLLMEPNPFNASCASREKGLSEPTSSECIQHKHEFSLKEKNLAFPSRIYFLSLSVSNLTLAPAHGTGRRWTIVNKYLVLFANGHLQTKRKTLQSQERDTKKK